MGFIQRVTGTELDFKIVTMSLWFRIPATSFTAAEANTFTVDHQGRWRKVIPLVTWGPETVGTETPIQSVVLGETSGAIPEEVIGTELGTPQDLDQGPGYIGVSIIDGDGFLDVYIPAGVPASCERVTYIASGFIEPEPPDDSWEFTYTDVSEIEEGFNDFYGAVSGTQILPDTVYHLLISWDLTAGSASVGSDDPGDEAFDCITESSQMWMALNDANKTAENLPMIWPGSNPEDFNVNRHVSFLTNLYAAEPDTHGFGLPAVTTTLSSVPSDPISIPGLPSMGIFDPINFKVQMGDLQIFTGVSLDTSIEENRRAFITSAGRPASPALAASLMGKDPEIRFQTTNDWQIGNNRGTAGDFVPTGTINDYEFDYG